MGSSSEKPLYQDLIIFDVDNLKIYIIWGTLQQNTGLSWGTETTIGSTGYVGSFNLNIYYQFMNGVRVDFSGLKTNKKISSYSGGSTSDIKIICVY